MKVLAIDPGGTTGLAFRDFPNGKYEIATASTPEELFDMISPALDVVVIESFRAQRIDHWGLYTVRLVGGVYALCHAYKIKYVVHQPTERRAFLSKAKSIITDRRHVVHEMDALAHLLRWEHRQSGGRE